MNHHIHISSGVFPYRIKENGVQVLLIRKKNTKEWHLPKGTKKQNGKIEDTAVREMLEETGYQIKLKRYLGWVWAQFKKGEKIIPKKTHYFLTEILPSKKINKRHDNEHDQLGWFSLDKAKKMIQDTNPVNEIELFNLVQSYLPTQKGESSMKLPTIIIEGGNFSGKSSIAAALEGMLKNSTQITFHGYWRKELTQLDPKALAKYFQKRSESFLAVINAHQTEEVIFLRLHLTDVVYTKLYLDLDQDYSVFEKELNKRNVFLVLLDVNDEALKSRSAELKRGKSGHCDRSDQTLIVKRNLYRESFHASLIQRKLLLDTSHGSPEENARKIINWINRGRK